MVKGSRLAGRGDLAFIAVPCANKDLKDGCRKHVLTDAHANAAKVLVTQPTLEAVVTLNDAQTRRAMEHKFMLAYWVVKERLANSTYESLHDFLTGCLDGAADLLL